MRYSRRKRFSWIGCWVISAALSAEPASAQTSGKIPLEVIAQTAAKGSALVLVGLSLPWQMESRLSEDELQAQRAAIASVQRDLLDKLAGRNYRVVRRYQEIPGIALEVGADALAELARLPMVTNVLLDRVGGSLESPNAPSVSSATAGTEKVPANLFARAARDGTVLVLAGLRTPWQHEDGLSEELWTLQRNAILSAQRYVLAELAGTSYKVTRLYGKIPGIGLRVGLDALLVLENSPAITNVILDRPAQVRR